MINRVELIMRRRSVYAFIAADEMAIELSRNLPPVQNPGTGGYIKNPDSPLVLDPQGMRIIQNVRRFTDGVVNSEAGDIPNTEYRLIARHTADIEVNDEFVWRGENYKITGIHGAREESILAAIDMLGEDNRNG